MISIGRTSLDTKVAKTALTPADVRDSLSGFCIPGDCCGGMTAFRLAATVDGVSLLKNGRVNDNMFPQAVIQVLNTRKSASVLTIVLLTLLPLAATAAQEMEEYALKTTYLYNFALFTTWPTGALTDGDSIAICTMGNDRFGSHIEQLQGRKVRDRQLVVKRSVDMEQAASCHILYIAVSEPQKMATILAALRDKSILTIADALPTSGTAEGTGELGADKAPRCIIMLVPDGKRLMFEVDSSAASQVGLIMSSRLLHLARGIH